MSEPPPIRHASRDDLIRYALGDLPEHQMAELELHVAGCDTCASRSEGIGRLAMVFDRLPDRVVYVEATIAAKIRSAVAGAGEAVAGLVGLVRLDATARLSGPFEDLVPPIAPFQHFATPRSAAPVLTRGPISTRGGAISRGGAVSRMEAIGSEGYPKCTILADGSERRVTVLLEGWPPDTPLPDCIVIPEREDAFPIIVEWVEQGIVHVAETEVPPADYLIAIVQPAQDFPE